MFVDQMMIGEINCSSSLISLHLISLWKEGEIGVTNE